jgi:hypothetical protein
LVRYIIAALETLGTVLRKPTAAEASAKQSVEKNCAWWRDDLPPSPADFGNGMGGRVVRGPRRGGPSKDAQEL